MNLFQELTSMFSRNQFVVKPPKGTDYFPLGIHKGNRRGSITKYPEVKLVTLKEVADYIASVNDQRLDEVLIVGNYTGGRDIFVTAGDSVRFTTTSKIKMGDDSNDSSDDAKFQILHNGSEAEFENTTGKITFSNKDTAAIVFLQNEGSGVLEYFRIDGVNKRAEFSKNVFVGDNIAFRAGTGGDLSISHNGTQSNINNVTGKLNIHCTTDALQLSGTQIDIGNNTGILYTLPLTDGTAGQVIKTDGSGNLSFQNDLDAQNVFQKIAVSGQNDVEADASNDTLTFIAGTGITLATDQAADSVTFTNSAPNVDQNLYETIAIQNSGGTTNIKADNVTDTFTIKEGAGITLNEDASNQLVSIGVKEDELPVTRGMSSTINHLVANGQGDYRIQIHMINKTTGSPNENDTSVGPQLIVFSRQQAALTNQGGMPWNLYYNQFSPALDPGYDASLGLGSSTTGLRVLMEESVKDVLARQGSANTLNNSFTIASFDVGQLKSFRMPLRMRVDNAGSSPGNGTIRLQVISAASGASGSPDSSVDANILPSTVYVYFRDTTLTSSKMGGPPFNLLWAGKDTSFAKFQNNGVAYTAGCDYVFSGNSGGDITRKYELFFQDEIASLGRFSSLKVTDSRVVFEDLPTSDPVSKGVLWNDSGTLKISAG